jgi:predicted CoA-binding protein
MAHDNYTNADLLRLLRSVRTIAVVGASTKPTRPSFFVMKYLQRKGYRVIPVNPRAAGEVILGETCYADLADVPDQIDMVDIFRNSEAAGEIVDQAIALVPRTGIRAIWMQLDVRNDAAAARAEAAGLEVVMDRCPKIEFGRLNAELSWGGFNSRVLTSRRRQLATPNKANNA